MTNQRIVTVGLDGSTSSSNALAWAAREAAKSGAAICAVHAYSLPVYGDGLGIGVGLTSVELDALHGDHEQMVENQLAPVRAAFPKLEITTRIEIGAAVPAITDAAEGAQLVVVGSRGSGSWSALLLGSVAHGVAHRARCPVALIPDGEPSPQPERVIVGTDGSPAAAAAIDWARREACLWGVELTVVHVWDYPYVGPRTGTVEPVELMELDAAKVLAHDVQVANESPRQPHRVHAKLLRGSPAEELAAEAGLADLLVVAARGRGAWRSAVLGSTSSSVIHRAHCPVVIVHAPVEE